MQPIRVGIRATDPATLADIERELEALRGQEPPGAELIDDPSPRPKGVDPLLATLAIALVTGAGSKLGEVAMAWLIERIRRIVKNRQARVTLTVAGVELTVDEQTDANEAAVRFGRVLGKKP
jgi:hypothetical protein